MTVATQMKSEGFIPQAAAIPFRKESDGKISILLIRWMDENTWGVPKGLVDPGYTAEEAALNEAHEEAGVEGTLSGDPLGEFTYEKYGGICRVVVYPMMVSRMCDRYREKGQRERRWFEIDQAIELVERKPVKLLIGELKSRLA